MSKKKTVTEAVVEETKQEKAKMATDDSIVELEMNLEDYEDFEPLPKGPYPAEIIQSETRIKEETGNEYFYIVFQIHPDDYPADYARENNPEGTRLTYARIQKPSAKNRRSITAAKNFMRAIGANLKTSTINPGEWEGKKAKLNISVGEFNGMPNNQIDSIEALD